MATTKSNKINLKVTSSKPVGLQPKTSIKRNFWVTFFKLAIPSILLLTIIFGLLSSWRAGTAINTNYKVGPVLIGPNTLIKNIHLWKNLSMWFAIISIFIAIACFSVSKNTIVMYSLMTICAIMIIVILVFSIMCIMKTTDLLNTMPNGHSIYPPPPK